MNARERMRREARRERTKWWAAEAEQGGDPDSTVEDDPRRQEIARPSRYHIFITVAEAKAAGISKGPLYNRSSEDEQDLKYITQGCRLLLKDHGIKVRSFAEYAKGHSLDPDDRTALFAALEDARRTGYLFVPCISRLVRSARYHPYLNPDARPTVAEFEAFLALVPPGVKIVVMNDDPNSKPPEDETFLRDLRAKAKRKPVGRPRKRPRGYCKDRKERWLDDVRQMQQAGMSLQEIARTVSEAEGTRIGTATLSRWLQ